VTLTFSLLKCADSKSPYTVFQNGDLASAHFSAEKIKVTVRSKS